MNMPDTKKRGPSLMLWLLLAFVIVSCSESDRLESSLSEVPPAPTTTQPVEYGASLSEWEDATQTDVSQTVGNDGIGTGPTAVVPTATADVPNTSVSTEPDVAGASIPQETSTSSAIASSDATYQEILWEALVPANFTADAIMAKYQEQLAQFEDGSPEAYELYTQMQEEFNNAPVNATIDGMLVRLPGFIAPLDYSGDLITEFLLVPYFGACIHVPPPPVNQTVLVRTAEGQGIKLEDSYDPIWIMGELMTQRATTELAEAGYFMENALIEPYVP